MTRLSVADLRGRRCVRHRRRRGFRVVVAAVDIVVVVSRAGASGSEWANGPVSVEMGLRGDRRGCYQRVVRWQGSVGPVGRHRGGVKQGTKGDATMKERFELWNDKCCGIKIRYSASSRAEDFE